MQIYALFLKAAPKGPYFLQQGAENVPAGEADSKGGAFLFRHRWHRWL